MAIIPSMADRDGVIWKDGEIVDWRDAKIHVLTHTLHYGMGVFEGVRAYKTHDGRTAIFRLDDHTKRLLNSAKIFHLNVPYTFEELNQAHKDIVRQNNLESAYIRPLIWVGSEKLSLHGLGVRILVKKAWQKVYVSKRLALPTICRTLPCVKPKR